MQPEQIAHPKDALTPLTDTELDEIVRRLRSVAADSHPAHTRAWAVEAICQLRRQRDALLVAIKPMLFAPATRGERRLNDHAQAAIAFTENGTPLPRDMAARIIKAEGL